MRWRKAVIEAWRWFPVWVHIVCGFLVAVAGHQVAAWFAFVAAFFAFAYIHTRDFDRSGE